jgi:hypothetical protein
MRQDRITRYDCLHLERLQLGMPYPDQFAHVARLLDREPLKGAKLVIDFTGAGRPCFDIAHQMGLKPIGVAISGGDEVHHRSGDIFTVPKQTLISGLEAKMHCGEFKIAPSISAAFIDELKDFEKQITASGRNTFNARNGAHDDLILSVAIALWYATNETVSSVTPIHF